MNNGFTNDFDYVAAYNEWWSNRTQNEYNLQGLFCQYEEEYFEDMTLQENSPAYNIAQSILDNYDDVFITLEADYIRFIVCINQDYAGCFNRKEHKIEIDHYFLTRKDVILHEMIHFYEYKLSETNPALSEYLLLSLYNRLSKQIPNLHDRIEAHADMFQLNELERRSGTHGILFYLKSLDLDLRCGFNLGTVCGYGRDK